MWGEAMTMLETSGPSGRIMGNGKPARGRPIARRQTGDVLRTVGLRDRMHPHDISAFLYLDKDAFDCMADAERTGNAEAASSFSGYAGNTVHGPFSLPDGIVGIVDMTPAMRGANQHHIITDPALPDDYRRDPRPAGS
jgi:hypothetical protein